MSGKPHIHTKRSGRSRSRNCPITSIPTASCDSMNSRSKSSISTSRWPCRRVYWRKWSPRAAEGHHDVSSSHGPRHRTRCDPSNGVRVPRPIIPEPSLSHRRPGCAAGPVVHGERVAKQTGEGCCRGGTSWVADAGGSGSSSGTRVRLVCSNRRSAVGDFVLWRRPCRARAARTGRQRRFDRTTALVHSSPWLPQLRMGPRRQPWLRSSRHRRPR